EGSQGAGGGDGGASSSGGVEVATGGASAGAATGGSSAGGALIGGTPGGAGVAIGGAATGGQGAGGAGTGGQATGGAAAGGAPVGGVAAGGATTGGQATGGVPSGGAATGGSGTGGAPTGGAAVGGQATGGVATGGLSTGGSSTGGVATTGGASTGGASTGGASTGGADNGGVAPAGGAATGGATTGGSSGAVPSSGCGKTSTLTFGAVPGESGTSVGVGDGGYVTIQSGSDTRGFAVRLPDDYDNQHPYPVVFGFHWNGGNSKEVDTGGTNGYQMAHFGLQKLSGNGAIFVAPDGLNAGWANSGGRDLRFVDDMVQLIEENYCVDTTRLFANGFSYGGGMSYALACARADVFRGVAIYDGAVLSGCDGGNDPIAYWQMAGLTDGVCTIDMARPMRDRFVQNNGCTPQEPPQPPQPPPYLSPGGHVCTDYAGCSGEHPLRWCVHQSGHGNAIVDGTADLYNSCATPPNSCSDACPCTWVPEDVWSFFSAL
ncbi:MAG TPA: prolyl oligopeptidase family serine peptidase, partial [Polyangiaceae bacterium]|nr:prolyl oligopeptidase family serine peptidase [Polyangiaceae bacterium]